MGQIYDLHSQQYSDGHAGELGKEGWAAGATAQDGSSRPRD